MSMIDRVAKFITRLFPLWVLLCAAIAFFFPEPFKPLAGWITWLLGIVMLGMGLTMKLEDFKLVLSRSRDVLLGVVLRYLLMPLIAFGVSKLLGLSPSLAAGLILVGCCPSGTASNVMTFIARGDTALSVTVSSINTLLAPVVTPFIFLWLAGTMIPVNASALLLDIVKVVLAPIALGVVINMLAGALVQRVVRFVPMVSVVAIILIIATVVALSAAKLMTVAWIAFVAVALALAHLNPVAAIPGAIFSVWHNFTGSLLAGYWGGRPPAGDEEAE